MKKILFLITAVLVIACSFALIAGAQEIPTETEVTLGDGTVLPLYDESGEGLIWFIVGTDANGKNVYSSVAANDSTKDDATNYITYSITSTYGTNQMHDMYINYWDSEANAYVSYGKDNSEGRVVVMNMRTFEKEYWSVGSGWSSTNLEYVYHSKTVRDSGDYTGYKNLKIVDFSLTTNFEKFGEQAFKECPSLREVRIGDSEIGYELNCKNGNLFNGSTSLTRVLIVDPSDVTLIGSGAFYNCSSLTAFDMSEMTNLKKIEQNAFHTSGITSVTFPKNLEFIGYRAFRESKSLSSVTFLGTSVTKLDGAAFENCSALLELEIPEGVTYIGTALCQNCKALQKITFPSTLTTADGANHFMNTALNEVVGLENTNLTSIPGSMFRGLKNWKPDTIVLPNTVKSIGQYGLADVGMKNIVLGASIEKIEHEAFTGCSSLTNVYVPETITTLGSKPFNGKGVYFFVTSTDSDYLATIYAKTGSSNEIVSWADYSLSPDSYKNGKYLISGYNKCTAFYNGTHGESATEYGFVGEQYTSEYYSYTSCQRCGETVKELVCNALFVNKGYSKENGGSFFTYGIIFNKDEIAKYVSTQAYGYVFNYGIVLANAELSQDGTLFAENGEAISGAYTLDVTSVEYTIFNLKITGIGEAQKNTPIYASAYVIENGVSSYIGDTVTEKAVAVTYNTIKKED